MLSQTFHLPFPFSVSQEALQKPADPAACVQPRKHHILEVLTSSLREIGMLKHGKNLVLLKHHIISEDIQVHMGKFVIADHIMYIVFRNIDQNTVFHQAELTGSGFSRIPVL